MFDLMNYLGVHTSAQGTLAQFGAEGLRFFEQYGLFALEGLSLLVVIAFIVLALLIGVTAFSSDPNGRLGAARRPIPSERTVVRGLRRFRIITGDIKDLIIQQMIPGRLNDCVTKTKTAAALMRARVAVKNSAAPQHALSGSSPSLTGAVYMDVMSKTAADLAILLYRTAAVSVTSKVGAVNKISAAELAYSRTAADTAALPRPLHAARQELGATQVGDSFTNHGCRGGLMATASFIRAVFALAITDVLVSLTRLPRQLMVGDNHRPTLVPA
jgi:hypothetical protein